MNAALIVFSAVRTPASLAVSPENLDSKHEPKQKAPTKKSMGAGFRDALGCGIGQDSTAGWAGPIF